MPGHSADANPDELDIIGMAGVNLENEASSLLQASHELVLGELPSSHRATLLNTDALRIRVTNISK